VRGSSVTACRLAAGLGTVGRQAPGGARLGEGRGKERDGRRWGPRTRERGEGKEESGGGWEAGRARRWGLWAPSGPLGLGFPLFSISFLISKYIFK
jgi:hypothetical protein